MTDSRERRSLDELVVDVRAQFDRVHQRPAQAVALAPGRVNLIGEHTDYNEGFVLPMAIDRYVAVAFAPRGERHVNATATIVGESTRLRLEALVPTGRHEWHDYVAGVLWALSRAGVRLAGCDLVVDATLPVGAGLSSSAAIEMAVARAACHLAGLEWDARKMAHLGTEAENQFVGMGCGVMDQLASACAVAGTALLIDCRSLEIELVPLPSDLRVLVLDTGVRRRLGASAFNARRGQCQRAVARLRARFPSVRTLRDVDEAMLDSVGDTLEPDVLRRARHVVGEVGRPRALAAALHSGDRRRAGAVLDASHASLRDLYDVSSPELDRMVALARAQAGCLGARLTGAGFGGCAIALVDESEAETASRAVEQSYNQLSVPTHGAVFPVRAVGGATLRA